MADAVARPAIDNPTPTARSMHLGRNIRHGERFGDLPLVKVRELLRAMDDRPHDDASIAELARIDLPLPVVTAFRSEFMRRGLFRDRRVLREDRQSLHGFTDAGLALATLNGKPRTDAERARRVLGALLDRCAANNSDPERFHDVDEVWLFGSLAKGAADVGDVDVVIVTSRKEDAFARFRALADDERNLVARSTLSESAARSAAVYGPSSILDSVTDKRLHGIRRDPLISLNDLRTLVGMHEPCRLVFSGRRGGKVDDPLLAHHPDSTGRSSEIAAKLTMPDLGPADLPAPIVLAGLAKAWMPETMFQVHCSDGADTRRYGTSTVEGLRLDRNGTDRLLDHPDLAKLDPPAREGDLVILPEDPSDPLPGVLRFAQHWSREADAVVATLDLELVGEGETTDWTDACAAGHVAFLAAVSIHLAKRFTTAGRTTIRLKAMDERIRKAVDLVVDSFDLNPPWALDGAENRGRNASVREYDPHLFDGVTVAHVGPGGEVVVEIDLGEAFAEYVRHMEDTAKDDEAGSPDKTFANAP